MTPDLQPSTGILPTDELEMNTEATAGEGRDSERGQGMIEYCLIVVLIGIFVILTVQVLGHHVNTLYSNVRSKGGDAAAAASARDGADPGCRRRHRLVSRRRGQHSRHLPADDRLR